MKGQRQLPQVAAKVILTRYEDKNAHSEANQKLEEVAQKGCGVSILADIPEQPAAVGHTLSKRLDGMTPRSLS